VTIVFDSHHNHSSFFPTSFNQKGLEIVYTASKQTADEYILEKLSFSKNNSLKTIVTSDNFLAKESRKLGAHTVSIDEFLKVVLKKKKNKYLNENKIEHSFENERWLKIFEENFKKKEY
jgi:predicted RNA-binding protein with PIN domain